MSFVEQFVGKDLMLTRIESEVEKAEGEIKIQWNLPAGFGVGLVIVLLVAFAVILFVTGHDEAGRVVVDLAALFLGWITGRRTGETAGAQSFLK